jgi:hypothetical protein
MAKAQMGEPDVRAGSAGCVAANEAAAEEPRSDIAMAVADATAPDIHQAPASVPAG